MTAPPYPAYPPPHSHDKYVGAIVGVGIIALLIGAALDYGLGSVTSPVGTSTQPRPSITYTHGTTSISPDSGTPIAIYFDNQVTGTLTSVISSGGNYQLYLPSERAYQVTIYWYESSLFSTNLKSCAARPQPFTPSGSDYTQSFLC